MGPQSQFKLPSVLISEVSLYISCYASNDFVGLKEFEGMIYKQESISGQMDHRAMMNSNLSSTFPTTPCGATHWHVGKQVHLQGEKV